MVHEVLQFLFCTSYQLYVYRAGIPYFRVGLCNNKSASL